MCVCVKNETSVALLCAVCQHVRVVCMLCGFCCGTGLLLTVPTPSCLPFPLSLSPVPFPCLLQLPAPLLDEAQAFRVERAKAAAA